MTPEENGAKRLHWKDLSLLLEWNTQRDLSYEESAFTVGSFVCDELILAHVFPFLSMLRAHSRPAKRVKD